METEKLIITCEVDDLPAGSFPMSFDVCFVQERSGIMRLFGNFGWKKITYRRAVITKLEKSSA
jgi:hypothetical protein